MAREYSKEYAADFLEKARRFIEIAKDSIEKFPPEAAFNATQAVINANDALTIFSVQKRASMDHREAVILDLEAAAKLGIEKSRLSIVNEALDLRSATGYDIKRILKKEECELLLKRTERFVNFVESLLKN